MGQRARGGFCNSIRPAATSLAAKEVEGDLDCTLSWDHRGKMPRGASASAALESAVDLDSHHRLPRLR